MVTQGSHDLRWSVSKGPHGKTQSLPAEYTRALLRAWTSVIRALRSSGLSTTVPAPYWQADADRGRVVADVASRDTSATPDRRAYRGGLAGLAGAYR